MKDKLTVIPVAVLSLFIANHFLLNPVIAETQGSAIESTTPAVGDTSQNALDWNGVYEGILPCADCEGTKTTITLNQDLTFVKKVEYLGKDQEVFENQGTFKWNETGNRIILEGLEDTPNQFIVGENVLIQLDIQGNRITGEMADKYILTKTDTSAMEEEKITDRRWELIEMMGKPVTKTKHQREAIFINFNSQKNRVNGFAGCNNFMGGFEVKEGNRIKLSQMASTMMACDNLDVEGQFMTTLQQVDNYTIKDGILSLNKAKMSPLLKFKSVADNNKN